MFSLLQSRRSLARLVEGSRAAQAARLGRARQLEASRRLARLGHPAFPVRGVEVNRSAYLCRRNFRSEVARRATIVGQSQRADGKGRLMRTLTLACTGFGGCKTSMAGVVEVERQVACALSENCCRAKTGIWPRDRAPATEGERSVANEGERGRRRRDRSDAE